MHVGDIPVAASRCKVIGTLTTSCVSDNTLKLFGKTRTKRWVLC